MAILRFPSKFDNGPMPWVMFRSVLYKWPKAELKTLPIDIVPGGDIISLYLPGDYSENINSRWGMQDVLGGATGNWAIKAATELDKIATDIAGAKVVNTARGAFGTVSYPTDILIFESTEPIQLSFEFNMLPVNKKEANDINAIATTFKKRIMPSVSTHLLTSGRLEFPYVWDIGFWNIAGLGLEQANRYEQMALTNINLSFPSGATSVLTYNDHNPVQTKMSLTFQSCRKHVAK